MSPSSHGSLARESMNEYGIPPPYYSQPALFQRSHPPFHVLQPSVGHPFILDPLTWMQSWPGAPFLPSPTTQRGQAQKPKAVLKRPGPDGEMDWVREARRLPSHPPTRLPGSTQPQAVAAAELRSPLSFPNSVIISPLCSLVSSSVRWG